MKKTNRSKKRTPSFGRIEKLQRLALVAVVAALVATAGLIMMRGGDASSCTVFVSTGGNDNNSGASLGSALRNPNTAVARASAGNVICIDAGVYGNFRTADKKGTATAPIVIKALPGKEHQAVIRGNMQAGVYGAQFTNSDHIHIQNLTFENWAKGIIFYGVINSRIENNRVQNIGEEAIHVGANKSNGVIVTRVSSYVKVHGNYIAETGKMNYPWAEGVYLGQGCCGSADTTNNIEVTNNTFTKIRSESVDIKGGVHSVKVRNNYIYDVDTWCEGALMVNAGTRDILLENNIVHKVTATSARSGGTAGCNNGIAAGIRTSSASNVVIRNNIVWDVRDQALRTKGLPSDARGLIIENNTFYTPASTTTDIYFESSATATIRNNYTTDGSYGTTRATSDLFRGPITGTADAGTGPGSGFQLKSYTGIGADYTKIGNASTSPTPTASPTPVPTPAPALQAGTHNDSVLTYSVGWATSTDSGTEGGRYNGDDHYSNTAGAVASFSFTGSRVQIYGSKAAHHGIASVKLGGSTATDVDLYAPSKQQQVLLYDSGDLANGTHSVAYQVTGTKNASSTGTYVVIDKVVISDTAPAPTASPTPSPTPPPSNALEAGAHNDTAATYSAGWSVSTDAGAEGGRYNGDDHYTNTGGSTASFSFTGTRLQLYGSKASHHGIAGISLNGNAETPGDQYAATRQHQALFYDSGNLPFGTHTVTLRHTGTKNASSTGTFIAFDKAVVAGSSIKAGDATGDGKIDISDLNIVIAAWGRSDRPSADLNQDGKVDLADFNQVLANWGK